MISTLYKIYFGKGKKVVKEAKEEAVDTSAWMKPLKELETKLHWTQNEVCYLRATQRKINKDLKFLND